VVSEYGIKFSRVMNIWPFTASFGDKYHGSNIDTPGIFYASCRSAGQSVRKSADKTSRLNNTPPTCDSIQTHNLNYDYLEKLR